MTKRTKQARVTKSRTRQARTDIYETVTARILEQLEQGVAPWKSPHFAEVGFPRNYQSGRCYQGCNVLLLGMAGFVSPYFLTYRQAQERGGQVRKVRRGT